MNPLTLAVLLPRLKTWASENLLNVLFIALIVTALVSAGVFIRNAATAKALVKEQAAVIRTVDDYVQLQEEQDAIRANVSSDVELIDSLQHGTF